jgi:hypothetical protein
MIRAGGQLRQPATAQAGAALFTALVFLVVLTLLGTFGLQQARLEHRMAGNVRFSTQALASAEYVLGVAEADIAARRTDPFQPDRPGDPYYPRDTLDFDPAVPGVQRPRDRAWTFASATVSVPDIDGDGSDSNGDGIPDDGTGQYVVQEAGRELTLHAPGTGGATPAALTGTPVQAFLITARGHAPGGVQRTLQSVYVRPPLTATPGGALPARQPGQGNGGERRGWIDLHE